MSISICAVVPTYNHDQVLPRVVSALRERGLPIVIVDDGSTSPASENIARLRDPDADIVVERLPVNLGKGGAVMHGLRWAADAGYTHVVQVDADGQHDLAVLDTLLGMAADYPDDLISGHPQYDETMPTGRRIGRQITHFWVCVETMRTRAVDTMCGFRVYPLAATLPIIDGRQLGRRMDFDIEIMVRMIWAGVHIRPVPVRVVYPAGNTSNFAMLRDNVRISWMHTKLVVEGLLRLPLTLLRSGRRNGGQRTAR